MTTRRRDRLVDAAVSVLLAAVVLGPLLVRRGYVLRSDMVFVPDQPWKPAWLGLDGRVPRFVPGDALLATLGAVLPGDLVQRLLLLVALLLLGCGTGRLVARHGATARAAAIVLATWNPWVLERLAMGQWGVVVGYGLLPWVVLAATAVRDRPGLGTRAALAAWLGAAAIFSPASALVALASALAVLAVARRRAEVVRTLLVGVLVDLPWVLPSLLATTSLDAPAGQFEAFAPRGESSLGAAASILGLGGTWKSSSVPGERTVAVVVAASLVLVLVAAGGLVRERRARGSAVPGLLLVGTGVLVLALLTSVPVVADLLDQASAGVPPLGLLRDSHRYLGPYALLLAVGAAAATQAVVDRLRPGREALRAVAGLVVVAPVLLLPSLAWGLRGDWRPVDYPREWYAVRDALPPGRTVVLPWRGTYRGFAWNDRRAVLDPAPRFLPGDVLIDDRVFLGGRALTSEDALLRSVDRALASADPVAGLRALGVRSVLLERGNGVDEPVLKGAEVRHRGTGLVLWDLGPVTRSAPGRPGSWVVVLVSSVDVTVLTLWVVTIATSVSFRVRPARLPSGKVPPQQDMGGRP